MLVSLFPPAGRVRLPQFRDRLETYHDITPAILRQHHLAELLARVAQVAEQFGGRCRSVPSRACGSRPALRRRCAPGGRDDARLSLIAS
ncbi:hypothetical protein XH87_21680 [Bradyrhizobium sp. CCBAU 53415]|nr:hypothetical protein [Bradyrhizobium sp. CCBAU 53415]